MRAVVQDSWFPWALARNAEPLQFEPGLKRTDRVALMLLSPSEEQIEEFLSKAPWAVDELYEGLLKETFEVKKVETVSVESIHHGDEYLVVELLSIQDDEGTDKQDRMGLSFTLVQVLAFVGE